MRFRKLRIAWSLGCAIACMLLIVLWARSYDTADRLLGRFWGQQLLLLASKEGCVAAVVIRSHGAANRGQWKRNSYPVDDERSFPLGSVQQYVKSFGFGWLHRGQHMFMGSMQTLPDGRTVLVYAAVMPQMLVGAGPIVPYCSLVLASTALAGVPWLGWSKQFSLRTLLIATTLVAVVLGVIVLAASK